MAVVSDTPSMVVPAAELARVELAEAFERHRHEVFHHALRFGAGNRAWAEDLTHDVFLKLHAHLGSLEARAALGGWLSPVPARLALTRRRDEHGFLSRLATFFKPQQVAALDAQVDARFAARAA